MKSTAYELNMRLVKIIALRISTVLNSESLKDYEPSSYHRRKSPFAFLLVCRSECSKTTCTYTAQLACLSGVCLKPTGPREIASAYEFPMNHCCIQVIWVSCDFT